MRILFFILSTFLIISTPAYAEDDKVVERDPHLARVAVLDVSALLRDSKASKHIQEQMQKKRNSYQKQIAKLEKKLQETETKLIELRKEEDAEGFAEERKKFEKTMAETQKKVAELRGSLDNAYAKGMAELREAIVEIVADVSDKQSYDLVISRQEVVIVSKEIDITEAIMDRLNDDHSKIKLSFK